MSILKKKIHLDKKKYRTGELLEKVLPDQGVIISYHDNIIPFKKEIHFNEINEVSVENLLEKICNNENLSYAYQNDQLLIKYYDRPGSEYRYSISGSVRDKKSGEPLIGATAYIKDIQRGVATNVYGFYSFTLPKGIYEMIVSYVGYKTIQVSVELNKNFHFNIQLDPSSIKLSDVLIEEREEFGMRAQNILSSVNKLDMEMAGQIPYLGEVDVFQSSLLLPGISNVGEGVSGINVRGGTSDQNLIMLDEAVIYNSNHFFGLVSVFNPDAVKDVEILKGDLPAKYGGRNSSVMRIIQKEGNDKEFHLSGGVGLISSRIMVEGPALKGSANYLVSARSTFWDFLLRNTDNPTLINTRVNFQDYNAKIKFNLNEKNKIYVSGYYGTDANKFGIDALKKWGNRVASVRWNKVYKNKHFLNLTSYFSQYEYRVIEESESSDFVGTSRISDYAIKLNMATYLNPNNLLEYGAETIVHVMEPGERIPGEGSSQNRIVLEEEYGLEPSLYFSSEMRLDSLLTISVGARYSSFINLGNVAVLIDYLTEVESIRIPGDTLSRGESYETYHNLLPRVTIKFQTNQSTSIKMGHFVTVQYMHLLSNTSSPASSDFWKISGEHILPTTMHQTTLGFYKYIKKFDLDISGEFFYRKYNNVIDYKDGADLLFNESIETELLTGTQRTYGFEIFTKKQFGKLTGWIGYTLSKSERRIIGENEQEAINGGNYFPSNYDRTHDVAVTAIYQLTPNFSISSNFVYYTGRPYSFPDSKYEIDGMLVPHYPNRNLNRLSNYHRLDISATLLMNKKRTGEKRKAKSSWVFSLYNVYARKNAQAYFFKESEDGSGVPVIEKLSVLGSVIPSIIFNFKF